MLTFVKVKTSNMKNNLVL